MYLSMFYCIHFHVNLKCTSRPGGWAYANWTATAQIYYSKYFTAIDISSLVFGI